MRELTSEEVMLVSGGTDSLSIFVVNTKFKGTDWGKIAYKQFWKDAFDNAKNVRAGDEAALAWLDAAWELENAHTEGEPDPAPAPAPAPTPVLQPSDLWIMDTNGGGWNWWDAHIHAH
jgi:hypothetical protein